MTVVGADALIKARELLGPYATVETVCRWRSDGSFWSERRVGVETDGRRPVKWLGTGPTWPRALDRALAEHYRCVRARSGERNP